MLLYSGVVAAVHLTMNFKVFGTGLLEKCGIIQSIKDARVTRLWRLVPGFQQVTGVRKHIAWMEMDSS